MSQLKVYFIRHGLTTRNATGRMCGRTDALVSGEGWEELKELYDTYEYPTVEKVYASPAARCRETASIFFPEQEPECIYNFWEYDFGEMEDVHMSEVCNLPVYEKWLNQTSDCGFPGGETLLEATFRSQAAMTRVVKDCMDRNLSEVAVIAHGEILNLLMSACLITEEPPEAFLLCPNGMGYIAVLDKEDWFREQKMEFAGFLPEGAPRPKAEDSLYFSRKN